MSGLHGGRLGSRRSEQGSVLSGMLVIIALTALILSALLPEVSSHLLASRSTADHVRQEAALSAALEYRLRGLQDAPLGSAGSCTADGLNNSSVNVVQNGLTAKATYVCNANTAGYPTGPTQLAGSRYNPFRVGGVQFLAGSTSELVVGDSPASGGWLYDYQFGATTPLRWTLDLAATYSGTLSAPPAAAVFAGAPRVLVPLSVTGTACGVAISGCVMEVNDPPSASGGCATRALAASSGAQVLARPALGSAAPGNVYFGDSLGVFSAYNGATCARVALNTADLQRPLGRVVAGPVVFAPSGVDELFALVTTAAGSVQPPGVPANSTLLVHYSCRNPAYTAGGQMDPDPSGPLLLWGSPSGVAMTIIGNPMFGAVLAATGANGEVAVVSITPGGGGGSPSSMAIMASGALPGGATPSGAPSLCLGTGCSFALGIGSTQGTFFVLNPLSLATMGSFTTPGGAAISTDAGLDSAGNWFFGAQDGHLYQVQGDTAAYVVRHGPVGAIQGAPVVATCGAGPATCVYFGTGAGDGAEYMVRYTAGQVSRNGYVYACIVSAGSCTRSLRLWARVVANGGSAKIGAWSYYSP